MIQRQNPRARDLNIPFDGTHGTANAITDVTGVKVGHCNTQGSNQLNTGVTAILPLGNLTVNEFPNPTFPNGRADDDNPGIDTLVMAAWATQNGCGEMTGTTWIEESDFLEGPIMLTNTASVGAVRDGVIAYAKSQWANPDRYTFGPYLPVIAETYDGYLNDILNVQITQDMVFAAINDAKTYTDPKLVEEGNYGGGTGMTCYSWKGGIGTSSRQNIKIYRQKGNQNVQIGTDQYTVGVLVQANQGTYWDLMIRGVPVGIKMTPPDGPDPPPPSGGPGPIPHSLSRRRGARHAKKSSIIVVIATDAPLLPHQLKRMARRAALGIGRTGTITNEDSGEIFIAFSTANLYDSVWFDQSGNEQIGQLQAIPNDSMDELFEAVVGATEEAIINALVTADTLETVIANETDRAWRITDPQITNPTLLEVMAEFNRLNTASSRRRNPRPRKSQAAKRPRPAPRRSRRKSGTPAKTGGKPRTG